MGNKQNVIELNGKRYDAHTGHVLAHPGPAAKKTAPTATKTTGQAKVIDGFTRRPHAKATHASSQPKVGPHRSAAPSIRAKPERSKTLMRHVVPKPTHHDSKKLARPVTKHSDAARAARAHKIAKSHLISKFGNGSSGLTKKVAALTVQEPPTEPFDQAEPEPPVLPHHTLTINPFEDALKKADSHKQPKLKKTGLRHRTAKKLRVSPKALNIGATVAVMLLISGVVAYRSIPSIAVHMASTRAGVRAALPGYQPAGFSLAGPVQYSKGQITLSYKSNSDSRSFNVVQKKSDWNSQSLLDNFVASNSRQYQTFQDKGKTIYLYDGNATWVSGGIWYLVEGESALNADQLIRIASSI